MDLHILPLAITMMAGPQIMSAIIFVTTPKPVRVSLAFLLGVTVATTVGVAITRTLAALLGNAADLGSLSDDGSAGKIIEYVLVGLLLVLAVKNYVTRATAEPPKWLGTLMKAEPKQALKIGLMIILFMPSDIVVMLTVGTHLETSGTGFGGALPFIGLTVLIAALPLLTYLGLGTRAQQAMPKVREWTNSHSWLVNIIACLIFIVLIVA